MGPKQTEFREKFAKKRLIFRGASTPVSANIKTKKKNIIPLCDPILSF